jgi:hypothetical protein
MPGAGPDSRDRGTAGISAGKALLEETDRVQRMYAPEYDDEDE